MKYLLLINFEESSELQSILFHKRKEVCLKFSTKWKSHFPPMDV